MQNWTKSRNDPIEIAILLFDRFSNLCLANCLEPLRAVNAFSARDLCRWRFVTVDGGPVRSSSGLTVQPDGALEAIGRCDYLFVLASYDHDRHDTPANRQKLRQAARQARITAGFDTGAWLMAGAGLLRGRRATVHWDVLDGFAERFLDTTVERARWIADGPVLTCAGAVAAFDMIRALVRDQFGAAMALDVDGLFLTDRGEDAPLPQPDAGRSDPLVRRALALMRAQTEAPLSLTDLADRLNAGPRTLDRRFRAATGQSPGTVYRHLRLSAAQQMVQNGTLGIAEIALRTGYENASALTRAFRRRFGVSPREMRRDLVRSGP